MCTITDLFIINIYLTHISKETANASANSLITKTRNKQVSKQVIMVSVFLLSLEAIRRSANSF